MLHSVSLQQSVKSIIDATRFKFLINFPIVAGIELWRWQPLYISRTCQIAEVAAEDACKKKYTKHSNIKLTIFKGFVLNFCERCYFYFSTRFRQMQTFLLSARTLTHPSLLKVYEVYILCIPIFAVPILVDLFTVYAVWFWELLEKRWRMDKSEF